jgi:hypothetical protein
MSALTLPIGTNNSPAAVRQVIEVPPAGESRFSSIGAQRYYNKADLIILVNDTNVVVTSGAANNFFATVPWLQVTNFVRTNVNFTNQREGKTVKATEIDIAGLKQWNSNSPLRSIIIGGDIRTVYVADLRTQTSSTEPGVRLINGQTLPPQGLTVASPDPIYIQGHYNCPAAAVGTTNTSGTLPASIAADAITILSTAWDDSKSSGSLGSRGAGDTTVNAAFLAGIVQTSPATGYSGGVENFPRFLEDWSGKMFTYNGSMVVMFDSKFAVGIWDTTGTYYNAPIRSWAFDNNFSDPSKLPPATPGATIVARGAWRLAQPYSTNASFLF